MFSQRDPTLRKNGFANLYIKNLDSSIDTKALHETFSTFGNILSCKVELDSDGRSKGYGFVQFDKEESAENAIKRLNGMLINDKQVYVGKFIRRQERNKEKGLPKFTNVYVKNFSEKTTDEELKKMFERFGPITSAIVMKDANGKSRSFGFVNYENNNDAAAAVEYFNGTSLDDKTLYVGRAEKKAERRAKLKAKFEQERISRFEKLKGANLYLKNLDESVTDEKLKVLFSEFGTITSCKIMCDANGVSKGAGFVAFSNSEEATKALNLMNGRMIAGKPLYVAVAQRKEERKAWLQAHFARLRTSGTISPLPGIPAHQTGSLQFRHQPLYIGQVNPAFGFHQQQLLAGLPPTMSSNFVPFHLQRQNQPVGQQRSGPRRCGNSQQQQHLHNSNQGSNRHTTNQCNGVNHSLPAQTLMGSVVPMRLNASAAMEIPIPVPISRSTLASALASASPENQCMMLGEHLYPLVERLKPNHARKVTGMLLEMDQTEVLHLIESPDALKKKVADAMEVLRLAATVPNTGNQSLL
ncbi:polyadenylate-binding protein 5-like [Andrographis paniculata]|uniref:polyadenylate-binding protein 5-like n=1 Tax=Andrographis paniculata TaxID=175694 RepID=UPI0021E88580|nr:polyadenylate-binding protein 5-like [Andrographis paniculata]